jgi:hypothetical protein
VSLLSAGVCALAIKLQPTSATSIHDVSGAWAQWQLLFEVSRTIAENFK